jgi:hypothetical protein
VEGRGLPVVGVLITVLLGSAVFSTFSLVIALAR